MRMHEYDSIIAKNQIREFDHQFVHSWLKKILISPV